MKAKGNVMERYESNPAPEWAAKKIPERPTMMERIDMLVSEMRGKNALIRVFDVRYATEGIPEVGQDYLLFPGNVSFEVLETGNLNQHSQSTQPLKYPKLIPAGAILLVEGVDSH